MTGSGFSVLPSPPLAPIFSLPYDYFISCHYFLALTSHPLGTPLRTTSTVITSSSLANRLRLAVSCPLNLNRNSPFTASHFPSIALIGANDSLCHLRGSLRPVFFLTRFPFAWFVLLGLELDWCSAGSSTFSASYSPPKGGGLRAY